MRLHIWKLYGPTVRKLIHGFLMLVDVIRMVEELNLWRPLKCSVTALLEYCNRWCCSIREFRSFLQNSTERSNNVTKKHHAVKHNLYINMISFIRHFPLIVPVLFPFSVNCIYPENSVTYLFYYWFLMKGLARSRNKLVVPYFLILKDELCIHGCTPQNPIIIHCFPS